MDGVWELDHRERTVRAFNCRNSSISRRFSQNVPADRTKVEYSAPDNEFEIRTTLIWRHGLRQDFGKSKFTGDRRTRPSTQKIEQSLDWVGNFVASLNHIYEGIGIDVDERLQDELPIPFVSLAPYLCIDLLRRAKWRLSGRENLVQRADARGALFLHGDCYGYGRRRINARSEVLRKPRSRIV